MQGGALGFWRLPGGILTAVHRNAAKVEAARVRAGP